MSLNIKDAANATTPLKTTQDSGEHVPHHNVDSPGLAAVLTALSSGTSDVQAFGATSNLRLMGWSAREDAGTPAAVSMAIRHGTTTTAPALDFINLSAGGSDRQWYGPQGIAAPSGIFLDRIGGTSSVSIFATTVA